MADPEEVVVNPRGDSDEGSGGEAGRNSVSGKSMKRRRSRKRRNSGWSDGSARIPPSCQVPEEGQNENENVEKSGVNQAGGEQDAPPAQELLTQGDHRSRFYEHYRKEAEEFDKEFMKKYDEDLNTTLIFAGLFSAVTSAFIIEVNSQLQPDPNDETAALLRVLIYKIDNATFGNNPPTLPQWTGPPRTIVQVQAILFASLSVSLFSAFLAMLGKQWLNRYASTDMRGTAIERSQNRQRKLDGIITWYFDHVMESLPLMLQIGLLLLGYALSQYFLGINITVASVVIGIASLGVVFYLLVVIAGAASESCPYQTPPARILRHILPSALYSALSLILKLLVLILSSFRPTIYHNLFLSWAGMLFHAPWHIGFIFTLRMLLFLLMEPAVVLYRIGLGVARPLAASGRMMYGRLMGIFRPQRYVLDQQVIVPDLRCVSWMLQTSLDRVVRLSTLEHLATMTTLSGFDPAIVEDCFNAFVGCVNVNDDKVVAVQGLEQLAAMSALCFINTVFHLLVVDPTSSLLEDVRQRFTKVFPARAHFHVHQFPHTLGVICEIFTGYRIPHKELRFQSFGWFGYGSSTHENTIIAHNLVKFALLGYQRTQQSKVPRWILRFVLRTLSLDSPPPTSVVADCLSIVAVDLGCDIPYTRTMASDESVRVRQVSSLITQKVSTMVEAGDLDKLRSKHKPLEALLPYAVWEELDGRPEMFDMLLRTTRALGRLASKWHHVEPFVVELLSNATARAIVFISPSITWDEYSGDDQRKFFELWASAAYVVSRTEEAAQSVVDVIFKINFSRLQIASIGDGSWLKMRPTLPPICEGRRQGSSLEVVRTVRKVKNTELIKSYLLLVWSEWDDLYDRGFKEMCASVRKDFCGIGMGRHRGDLVQRLDHVLGQLDRGLEYLQQHNPDLNETSVQKMKHQYQILREILLEVNNETIAQSRATFMCALPLPSP